MRQPKHPVKTFSPARAALVFSYAAVITLMSAGCSVTAAPTPNPESAAPDEAAVVETPAAVPESLDVTAGAGPACTTLADTFASATTLESWSELDPALHASPAGVTLPAIADCAFEYKPFGVENLTALVWEAGDVDALNTAILAAGYAGELWSDSSGTKSIYTGAGQNVAVHSGVWINTDMPASAVQLSFSG